MRPGLAIFVLGLLGGCGLTEGSYFGHVTKDPDPTHLRWCNSGEPEYLDPGLVSSTTGVKLTYALFDGLTEYDLDGRPEPSLATHWDIAPDLRKFRFYLRKDAVWSNGRPLTAHDFVYHVARVLHPLTASKNAETHWRLKNGELYTANRVRMVMRDAGPFQKGDIVELLDPENGELPDSNHRTSSVELALRDLGAAKSKAYFRVPARQTVTIVEQQGAMSYVFFAEDDGVYGWVDTVELDGQPNGEHMFQVSQRPPEHRPGTTLPRDPAFKPRTAAVPGNALLMVPEVLGIRADGDHKLVFETWGPVPFIVDQSAQRAYRPSPREAVSRRPKRWIKPEHVVTSGAFHLAEWKERDYIRLKKSPTYWGNKDVKLETITAYSLNDQAASANYYYTGGCDAIASNNVPANYLPILRGEKRRKTPFKDYTAAPYLGTYFFLINTEVFDNVHYRRALSLATNRQPIPRFLNGGQLASSQYSPGMPIAQMSEADRALCGVDENTPGVAAVMVKNELCYVPPQGLGFHPEDAKRELALAEKEMGAKFKTAFVLKFNSGKEGHKLIAEYLQQEWKQILGLDVTLEVQEWKTFLKDSVAGNYEVARMGWIGNFPDAEAEFLPMFKCASPDNRTRFCDPEFERLFKEVERTKDRQKRLSLVYQLEKIIIDKAPVIPLYIYTQHHLQKPYVKDLAINFVDQIPFKRAWIDPKWRAAKSQRADSR